MKQRGILACGKYRTAAAKKTETTGSEESKLQRNCGRYRQTLAHTITNMASSPHILLNDYLRNFIDDFLVKFSFTAGWKCVLEDRCWKKSSDDNLYKCWVHTNAKIHVVFHWFLPDERQNTFGDLTRTKIWHQWLGLPLLQGRLLRGQAICV